MSEATSRVICFGEILWDILPRGRFPGGAPFNVAYHLHRQGLHPLVVSAVGRDAPGDELLQRLREWGIDLDGITQHPGQATGQVTVTLDPGRDARFAIARDVAWDQIVVGREALRAAGQARALVFGSLAQRSSRNQAALHRLLNLLPADALRVFDVNLRPPHDDLALTLNLARYASLLKLNAVEATRLTAGPREPGHEEACARTISARTGCPLVCITAGERGAGILEGSVWRWIPGRPVIVRDTVGAGDAFTAGLITGLLLHHEDAGTALARACRLGEFVAAQDGATPPYHADARGLPVPASS